MASWELTKENIQPLKSGRKVALIDQDAKQIQKEKEEFELALRTYSGPDPLEPWYKYIVWVEQTFAKGGKEGNLTQLLEKCIKEFKDDPVRNQDERYLEIWIKYATTTLIPLDIYKFMATEGICTKRPNFYVSWAWELEQAGNFKKAEQVFVKGLALISDEDEKRILETKHKQFQARVMKRMLETTDEDDTGTEESRTVLASLKGLGKTQKVGSMRVGAVKKSETPGVLLTGAIKKPGASNSKQISIFQDSENAPPSDVFPPSSGSGSKDKAIPIHRERNRENEIEPGKWSQAKLGKKSHAVPIEKISAKPAFAVHIDEDAGQPLTTPSKLSAAGCSKVLTTRKPAEEHHVAVALFEPPDPMKKPMYCKHLVYQGVTEFSFEELRAIKYRRKKAEEEIKQIEEEKRRWKEEQEEIKRQQSESIMRQNQELLEQIERQKIDFQKMLEEAKQRQREEFEMWAQEERNKLMQERPKMEAKQSYQDVESSTSLCQPSQNTKEMSSVLEDTKSLLQKSPGNYGSSKTPPRLCQSIDKLVQPSPTINTKEALNLMQQMWAGKSGDSSNQSVPFEVYEDEKPATEKKVSTSKSSSAATKAANSSTKAATNSTPFAIYCDEPEPEIISFPRPGLKNEFRKPLPIVEDKENQQHIQIYCDKSPEPAPIVKKEKEPSPIAHSRPMPMVDDNMTIRLPSMEAFAEMARAVSTPYHGRQFLPEEDDMTSKVEIVFKKPAEKIEPPAPSVAPTASGVEIATESENRPPPTLSPIMETSRENWYKSSSSSSSNASQSVAHLTKSHWGNTQYPSNISSAVSTTRTPGTGLSTCKPTDVTTSSGYMADSSSAKTPAIFLREKAVEEKPVVEKIVLPKIEIPQNPVTKPKFPIPSEDEDEMTGAFTDFMSEFQRNAGLNVSKRTPAVKDEMKNSFRPPISDENSTSKRFAANEDDVRIKPSQGAAAATENFSSNQFSSNLTWQRPSTSDENSPIQLSSYQTMQQRPSTSDENVSKQFVLNTISFRNSTSDENVSKRFTSNEDEVTLPLSSRKLEKSSFQGRNLKSCSSFINESLKMSFLANDDIQRDVSQNVTLEQWKQMSFNPQATLTGQSLRMASPGFEESCFLKPEMSRAETSMGLQPPTLELSSVSQIGFGPASPLTFPKHPNPFCTDQHIRLLSSIPRPVSVRHGYKRVEGRLPNPKINSVVTIADVDFYVVGCKGEGGFGKVFKALKRDDNINPNETIANIDVVLKVQKPAREWEFYICTELHHRLAATPSDRSWFMTIPRCYTYDDGSVFVSVHQSNTLLDICNQIPSLKAPEVEPIAMFFTIEMLKVAEILRKAKIIHADVKPENFLLQRRAMIDPDVSSAEIMFSQVDPVLQVIDFGVSIDMSLFPAATSFIHCFEKLENRSPDMLEGRPWTYQLDYFGMASVAYTLLFGSYMKILKGKNGDYVPSGSFKRWWNTELWSNFFNACLNIPSCDELPDLAKMRKEFENHFYQKLRFKFGDAIRNVYTNAAKNKM